MTKRSPTAALEHRLATHVATATTTCPSLTAKHVTMHTLGHTAAMNLQSAGVDVSVIALLPRRDGW